MQIVGIAARILKTARVGDEASSRQRWRASVSSGAKGLRF